MKRLLFIIVLIMCITQLQAQVRIGHAEAYATAEQFVSRQRKQTVQKLTLSEEIKSEQTGQTNLFVFAIESKGYVIVSALNEVLAYSLTSTLPASDELPDHIAYWLELYNKQTDFLIMHPSQIRKPMKRQHSVGPLLTSIWGQGCFHNEACPVDSSGPCQHVEAGCVAIAMAQIMYYHKQPLNGNGTMSYACSPYGTLSADFGHTTYQWEQMVDTLHESNPAVAKLVFHCGVSVKMEYSANSSVSSGSSAVNALQQFFSYPSSTLCDRSKYNDEDWLNLIKSDLDQGHPVYYSGKIGFGGHAFVCDGYDENGLFHFNFGWDGVADGFYTLDNPYGFSTNQRIISNIFPLQDIPISSDEHGIIYVTADGIGDGSSWEQATNKLQWAIFKAYLNDCPIWVKEGCYRGNSENDYAFLLLKKCRLYGGFKGDETFDYDLSQRDFNAHPTILDGNNVQGVINVDAGYFDDTFLIDGFTIQNGNASRGGGILLKSQTHIRNCKFRCNHARTNGGGLLQQSPSNSGSVIIENCEFFGNEAKNRGGGAYSLADGNSSQFIHCTFSNNTAKKGGGVATTKQGPTFWSCLVNNNTAETGGGCYFENGAKLFNCTIVKNEAQSDYGGIYVAASSPKENIMNCIIWGNVSLGENTQIKPATYSYCAVEDDASGEDFNLKADGNNDGELPRFYVRFRNPDVAAGATGQGGDWRLQSNSLCINRGKTIANQPATDLDGNPRINHDSIDLGAYETDVATHFIDAYYCEEEPYYYQDSILSGLGLYTFLYPAIPCDSLLIIQMLTPPPSVFLHEVICANETYDFFGTLLNQSGEYTATERCITYNLILTVMSLDSISIKEEICEGDAYDFFGELLYEAGHYSTTVDCKVYELDLTVNSTPWLPVSMEKEICEGESFSFFGRTLRYAGHYSTTIGCTTYDLDLTVNPVPEVHCSNDTLVEYGNLVRLTASGADTYLWSTGDTTQSITVYPVTDQTYTVQGFSRNGCSGQTSVKVQVSNESEAIFLYPNPADNKVEIYDPLIDEVTMFNLLGERVYRVKANREVIALDVSNFPYGVYVIDVRALSKHYYKKLVIQH